MAKLHQVQKDKSTGALIINQISIPEIGSVVHATGDETIAGVKTFTDIPVVPDPAPNDNSGSVASTAWVTANGGDAIGLKSMGKVDVYTGMTDPDNTLGQDGDFYVQYP